LYSPTEIVFAVTTIIAAITTMGVALITAWRTSAKVEKVGQAIADVKDATDGNFSEQKKEIEMLRSALTAAQVTATNAEIARVALAEAAKNAIADVARKLEERGHM
jgi:DNA-directed RNA polymerase beta' subunit